MGRLLNSSVSRSSRDIKVVLRYVCVSVSMCGYIIFIATFWMYRKI